jgi:transcriptional regulator with XRE-family HTH domain
MEYRTMYARHRNAAGITQEKAAELLGCAVRTVQAYESGEIIPPDHVVALMCDVFPAPMLALEHLRASSSMGRALIPEVTRLPLAQAACQLIYQIQDFTTKNRPQDLIWISSNGRVDEGDQERVFSEIVKELEGIVQASIQLRYAQGTGLPTDTDY